MATPVIMPRQGQSVESCIISTWNKKVGDKVAVGDVLFSYETDKASFEEEAKVDGTLLATFFEEGDDVPCLLNIAVIGNEGEDFEQFRPSGEGENTPEPQTEQPAQQAQEVAPIIQNSENNSQNENSFISPRAKQTAQQMHINYAGISGTGPNGRIIERDIFALAQNGQRTNSELETKLTSNDNIVSPKQNQQDVLDFVDVKISNIRRTIASNMVASLTQAAQLTHHISFNASNILEFRKNLKENAQKLDMPNITLNDIVTFAVSRALCTHKDMNAHYLAEQKVIRQFNNVNVGIAVDTPRGLMVPTLFNAQDLSLEQISLKTKEVAAQAQEGSISPDLLAGGTFTISNLGAFGIEMFTPVLNPPQVGLLGVNTIINRPYEEDGQIKLYPAMGLSLTYDHRALDGAPASRFLQTLKNYLENFTLLLAK